MPYRRINIPQEHLDEIASNPMWSIQRFVAMAIKNELDEQNGVKRFLAAREEEKAKLNKDVTNQ